MSIETVLKRTCEWFSLYASFRGSGDNVRVHDQRQRWRDWTALRVIPCQFLRVSPCHFCSNTILNIYTVATIGHGQRWSLLSLLPLHRDWWNLEQAQLCWLHDDNTDDDADDDDDDYIILHAWAALPGIILFICILYTMQTMQSRLHAVTRLVV